MEDGYTDASRGDSPLSRNIAATIGILLALAGFATAAVSEHHHASDTKLDKHPPIATTSPLREPPLAIEKDEPK